MSYPCTFPSGGQMFVGWVFRQGIRDAKFTAVQISCAHVWRTLQTVHPGCARVGSRWTKNRSHYSRGLPAWANIYIILSNIILMRMQLVIDLNVAQFLRSVSEIQKRRMQLESFLLFYFHPIICTFYFWLKQQTKSWTFMEKSAIKGFGNDLI